MPATEARPARAWLGADPVANLLDDKLRQRMEETVVAAAALLSEEAPTPTPQSLPQLAGRLSALLEAGGDENIQAEEAAHRAQLARLRRGFERRGDDLGRVSAAVQRLREITSPAAMLEAAPRLLGEASDFHRVMLSQVDGGVLTPIAAFFEGDPEGKGRAMAELVAEPIRLEHPSIELDALRRRRATIVPSAHLQPGVHPRLTAAMGWSSYAAAPVSVGGRIIGILHADLAEGELDLVHRDVLWSFATGLGQAHESASLRRALRGEREQMRSFLDRLDVRLRELSDSAIQLAPPEAPSVTSKPVAAAKATTNVGSSLGGILTPRELEVLSLMAEGIGNRAIADRLVVAEGTVKFHVHRILEKLRVANRVEAVSRYLTLQRRG